MSRFKQPKSKVNLAILIACLCAPCLASASFLLDLAGFKEVSFVIAKATLALVAAIIIAVIIQIIRGEENS